MIKYFLQRKNDGSIAMMCDEEPEYDKSKFNLLKLNITKTQEQKIKQAHKPHIEDGKLKLIKPPHLQRLDIKKKLKNASTKELREFLEELL